MLIILDFTAIIIAPPPPKPHLDILHTTHGRKRSYGSWAKHNMLVLSHSRKPNFPSTPSQRTRCAQEGCNMSINKFIMHNHLQPYPPTTVSTHNPFFNGRDSWHGPVNLCFAKCLDTKRDIFSPLGKNGVPRRDKVFYSNKTLGDGLYHAKVIILWRNGVSYISRKQCVPFI